MVKERTLEIRAAQQHLRKFARDLRRDQTDAERKFWQQVRDRRLNGHKFKRQYPIGDYIADFVCIERKLIVELDGGQHTKQQGYDRARSSFLAEQGFEILRFWNHDVLKNIDGVIMKVLEALNGGETPSPQPSPPLGEREQ